jgi:hypothetical protein
MMMKKPIRSRAAHSAAAAASSAPVEPGLTLGGTILRQRSRSTPIPIATQEGYKIDLAQLEDLLRSLRMSARHQSAADVEQQVARRPE